MGRGTVKVLRANHEAIVLQLHIDKYYRINIPKVVHTQLEPYALVKVTIERDNQHVTIKKEG